MKSDLTLPEIIKLPSLDRKRVPRRPLLSRVALIKVLIILFLAAIIIVPMIIVIAVTGSIAVPNVSTVPLSEAQAALKQTHLSGEVIEERYSTAPKNLVLEQIPVPGTRAKKGAVVQLVVSGGIEGFVIPDVTGQPEASATETLQGLGMEVSTIDETSDEAPGMVLSTVPSAGGKVAEGDAIVLHVAVRTTQVALKSFPLSGRTVVIEPVYARKVSGSDLTFEIARRLDSLVTAAEGTSVITRGVQEKTVSAATYAQRAKNARPVVFVRLSVDDLKTPNIVIEAKEMTEPSLGQMAFTELEKVFTDVTFANKKLTLPVAPDRGLEVSLGKSSSKANAAYFNDSQWRDNVARALYMAIGNFVTQE
jgi:hypothetical protein